MGTATSGVALDPVFAPAADPEQRAFTADVALSVDTVTVTGTAKPGWTVTYHDEPDANGVAGGYQRSLAVRTNRITVRATPTGASVVRNYVITVTRTNTPSAPRNLRAAPGDQSVRLTWTAPLDAGGEPIIGYEYRRKNKEDAPFDDTETWTSTDSTTSHDVTGLTNGVTYIFQVRARNANSNSDPNSDPQGSTSNTAEATPAGPLPRPTNVVATAGHRRVTLSWTRIADDSVSGYQYRRRAGTGSYGTWTTIADRDLVTSGSDGETRSYTVTGLTNGTGYGFQVRGRNSGVAAPRPPRS